LLVQFHGQPSLASHAKSANKNNSNKLLKVQKGKASDLVNNNFPLSD